MLVCATMGTICCLGAAMIGRGGNDDLSAGVYPGVQKFIASRVREFEQVPHLTEELILAALPSM